MTSFIVFHDYIKRNELTAQLNRSKKWTHHLESQKRFGPSVPHKRCNSSIQMRHMQAVTQWSLVAQSKWRWWRARKWYTHAPYPGHMLLPTESKVYGRWAVRVWCASGKSHDYWYGVRQQQGLVKATEALSMTTDTNSKYRRLQGALDITLKALQPVLGLMFRAPTLTPLRMAPHRVNAAVETWIRNIVCLIWQTSMILIPSPKGIAHTLGKAPATAFSWCVRVTDSAGGVTNWITPVQLPWLLSNSVSWDIQCNSDKETLNPRIGLDSLGSRPSWCGVAGLDRQSAESSIRNQPNSKKVVLQTRLHPKSVSIWQEMTSLTLL